MSTISLEEAQARLAELVRQITPGEGVTIMVNDRPVARLVVPFVTPRREPRPRPPATGVPRAGSCAGLFVVPDDLKGPLEELREYME